MAMSFAQGNFAKSTSGAPVDQAVTGVGFMPEVLILWATQNTSGGAAASHAMLAVGFASAAGVEASTCFWSRDATSPSDTKSRVSTSKVITFIDTATGLLAECDVKSFDSDGFTLTWTTNDGNAYIIHYIALAGDVTNALVGNFALNTSTGDQGVTGVGFQPDFLMLLGTNQTAAGTGEGGQISIGAATSSAQRSVSSTAEDNTVAVGKQQRRTTNRSNVICTHVNLGGEDALASLSSMDSDGFTINISNAPTTATLVLYLALKGGSYAVEHFVAATSTGNQSETGAGFEPVGYALFTAKDYTSDGAGTAHAGIGLGSADGTTQSTAAFSDENAQIDAYQRTDTDKVLTHLDPVDGSADLQGTHVSFDSDGFTVNWSAIFATGPDINWIAFGDGAAPPAGGNRRRALGQVV